MSVRVMTAVFDHSESRLGERLVLLVIADRSDDDGSGCFRGKESIARMARVDRATVTRAIQHLVEIGELEVELRPGRSSLYRVLLPGVGAICADPPEAKRAHPAPGVGAQRADGRRTVRRDPSSKPSSDPRDAAVEAMQQAAERTFEENEERRRALEADPGGPPPEGFLERIRTGGVT